MELELQAAVSHLTWKLGTELRSPGRGLWEAEPPLSSSADFSVWVIPKILIFWCVLYNSLHVCTCVYVGQREAPGVFLDYSPCLEVSFLDEPKFTDPSWLEGSLPRVCWDYRWFSLLPALGAGNSNSDSHSQLLGQHFMPWAVSYSLNFCIVIYIILNCIFEPGPYFIAQVSLELWIPLP